MEKLGRSTKKLSKNKFCLGTFWNFSLTFSMFFGLFNGLLFQEFLWCFGNCDVKFMGVCNT
jgi:hypothetical protein